MIRALLSIVFLWFAAVVTAADFNVTSPGSFYRFNGTGSNPTITLIRGRTYTFSIATASNHPFRIATTPGGATPSGVTGANGASSGTITFAVPLNAQNCSYYCTQHFFGGTIQMIDAPTPPTVTLVSLTATTNLVLIATQSTTNGFAFIPEANTNLTETNWFALTVNSNRFANGTNEIFCGKPEATNAIIRIRIQ